MVALPRLYPATPDGSATTMNAPVGATTYAVALQTNDGDTSYATSGLDSAGSLFVNLDNTPVDFGDMDTLTVSCVVRLNGARNDDTTQLYAQVFQADETTALTSEHLVCDHTTGTTYTVDSTAMTLTATGLAANKSAWDGAKLRLRWVFTKTMASDGIALRVTQAYLDGTYTAKVVDTTPPTAPTNLTASAASASQIDLSWTAATDNVTAQSALVYEVERSLDGSTGWSAIHTTAPGVTSWSNTGLASSTQYFYRVRTRDEDLNWSGYSTTASATTPAPAPLVRQNTFDGGTDGVVLDQTTSAVGGDPFHAVGNVREFDTAIVANGDASGLFENNTGGSTYIEWSALGSQSVLSGRFYFYRAAAIDQSTRLVQLRNSAGTTVGGIWIDTDGSIFVRDLNNTSIGTSGVGAWVTGKWVRMEFILTATTSEVRSFHTHHESTTPDGTLSGVGGTFGAYDLIRIGITNLTTLPIQLDGLRVDNTGAFPGPIGSAEPKTHTGTAAQTLSSFTQAVRGTWTDPVDTGTIISPLRAFAQSASARFTAPGVGPTSVVTATPNPVPDLETSIFFDATNSTGSIASHQWELVFGPAGYTGTFDTPTQATATLTPSASGGGGGTFPESSDYMSHGIITSKAGLDTQPIGTDPLWVQLTTEADRDDHGIAQISDHNAPFNTQTLAKAIVYARLKGHDDVTADAHRTNVRNRLQDFVNHTWATGASTLLAYARNLGALPIAADFINLASLDPTLDAAFRTKLQEGLTRVDSTATDGFSSLHDGSLSRPNNIGMACRFSLVAGYLYLGDKASIDTYVLPPHRRWLGDTTFHNGTTTRVDRFAWNSDQTWQVDPATEATWVGVNPQGAVRDGNVFDGIQPEDQRRGTPISYAPADFPNNYSSVKYIYDVVNVISWMALMLERAGYTGARNWSDDAVRRATERVIFFEANYAAKGYTKLGVAGQDAIAMVNYLYGTSHPVPDPANHFDAYFAEAGWTEWMFAGRAF